MSGIERTAAFVACQTDVRPAKRQKVENARAAFQHLARTAGEGQWDAACEAVGFKPEFQLRPTDVETVSCFVNKYVRVRRTVDIRLGSLLLETVPARWTTSAGTCLGRRRCQLERPSPNQKLQSFLAQAARNDGQEQPHHGQDHGFPHPLQPAQWAAC